MSEWRPIPGFPNYEINQDGDVRTTKTKEAKSISKDGKKAVRVSKDGKATNRGVRKILKQVFPKTE